VGQTGSVIGIDRERLAVERAGHRAAIDGLDGRVRSCTLGSKISQATSRSTRS
jgi:hypothetical protein